MIKSKYTPTGKIKRKYRQTKLTFADPIDAARIEALRQQKAEKLKRQQLSIVKVKPK
jgi:membrane protein YdbS with pleckstrin-like domain